MTANVSAATSSRHREDVDDDDDDLQQHQQRRKKALKQKRRSVNVGLLSRVSAPRTPTSGDGDASPKVVREQLDFSGLGAVASPAVQKEELVFGAPGAVASPAVVREELVFSPRPDEPAIMTSPARYVYKSEFVRCFTLSYMYVRLGCVLCTAHMVLICACVLALHLPR